MTRKTVITVATQLADEIAGSDAWMRNFGTDPNLADLAARMEALRTAAAAGPVSVTEAERIWDDPGRYRVQCDGCSRLVSAAITVGEDPADLDSRYAYLCGPCLSEALALFNEIPPTFDETSPTVESAP